MGLKCPSFQVCEYFQLRIFSRGGKSIVRTLLRRSRPRTHLFILDLVQDNRERSIPPINIWEMVLWDCCITVFLWLDKMKEKGERENKLVRTKCVNTCVKIETVALP